MSKNKSLSTQEVADILHVSKSTIYDLIRKGEIHSYKIGRKVRFTQDDVDAYIARSRHEHSTRPVKSVDTHSTLLTPEKEEAPELIISGQGAIRMTARELWNEVQAVETELREKFIENRPPKNNILADHLDEEALAWFEALRRQK